MTEEMITGYQYSPLNGCFIGVYTFPNNKDKEAVHMPPFTTLIPPPEYDSASTRPCWNGTTWVVLQNADAGVIELPKVSIESVPSLLPDFIEDQKRIGAWSDALEAALQQHRQSQEAASVDVLTQEGSVV